MNSVFLGFIDNGNVMGCVHANFFEEKVEKFRFPIEKFFKSHSINQI